MNERFYLFFKQLFHPINEAMISTLNDNLELLKELDEKSSTDIRCNTIPL